MRRVSGWVVLIAACLLIWPAAASAASKSFVWQHLETDVQVLEDGRLHVTETLTLRYAGGPFTYVKRNLASANLDDITDIAVRDADQSYQPASQREGKTPYTFSVFIEDGVKTVRWVYPPTSDATRTFTLSYTVLGAVGRYAAGDQLWWPIVFPARDEVVEQAVGHIRLPANTPARSIRANMPDFQGTLTVKDGAVLVTAANIPPDKKLTVVTQFPAGATSGAKPAWQIARERQAAYDASQRPTVDWVLGLMTAAMAVALFGLLLSWQRRWSDPRPEIAGLSETPEPPEDLAPALAAHLVNAGDAAAFTATLFDLARRGYIALVEKKSGLFGRSRSVSIARATPPADETIPLAAFEVETLNMLFGDEDEVAMSKRSSAIVKGLPQLSKEYQRILVERGYLDARRLKAKTTASVLGMILLSVAVGAAIVALIFAPRYSWWLPAIPGVAFVAGITWVILSASARGVTPDSVESLMDWRAFGRYLKRLGPDTVPFGQFELLLPYAAGLAQIGRFVKAFKQSNEPLPTWYHPLDDRGEGDAWAGVRDGLLLRDFSDGFAATAVIVAASSSSGGGAAGAAGGGAGGGSAG